MPSNLIKTSVTINPRFIEKFAFQAAKKKINDRLENAREPSELMAQNIIENIVKESQVYQGIEGKFSGLPEFDLQAEFGITTPEKPLQVLIDTLKKSVIAKITNNEINKNGKVELAKLEIYYLNPEDYEAKLLSSEAFIEQSKATVAVKVTKKGKRNRVFENTQLIYWMKILLDGKRNSPAKFIPGIDKYGITYDLSPEEAGYSRSHRALMTRKRVRTSRTTNIFTSREQSINFPYTMPFIAIPKAGADNFIDEIRKDPATHKILFDRIKKFIRSLK